MPSLAEGGTIPSCFCFSSLLEAMACGLPVVASDARGCRDLLHDAGASSLCQAFDYRAVGEALTALIENPERRKKLGADNRERIRPYSLDDTLAKMDAVYRSAMKKQIRVLHVLGSSKFYGAEHVVCDIIERFRGDTDVEMAYTSPDGEIAEALRAREIRFIPMKKLTPLSLKKAASVYRPDILHAHDVRAGGGCARLFRIPALPSRIAAGAFSSSGSNSAHRWA